MRRKGSSIVIGFPPSYYYKKKGKEKLSSMQKKVMLQKVNRKGLLREKVGHDIARPAYENKVVGCGVCQCFMVCVGHGAAINTF